MIFWHWLFWINMFWLMVCLFRLTSFTYLNDTFVYLFYLIPFLGGIPIIFMLNLHYLSFRSVIFVCNGFKIFVTILFYSFFFISLGISLDPLGPFLSFSVLIFLLWPLDFLFVSVLVLFFFYSFPEFCSLMFYNLQLSHYSLLKFLNFYFVVWPPWSNCFISLLKIMAQCLVTLYLGSVTPFLWWQLCISWKALQIFSTFLFIISFLLMLIEKLTFHDPAMFL